MNQEKDSLQRYVYLDGNDELAGVYDMPMEFAMDGSIETARRNGHSLMKVEDYEQQHPDKVKLRHIGGQAILELLKPKE